MEAVKDFVNKWTTPAGFLLIFGAIVWGVQLNFIVLKLVEVQAKAETKSEVLEEHVHILSVQSAETTAILANTTRELAEVKTRIQRNEGWIRDGGP